MPSNGIHLHCPLHIISAATCEVFASPLGDKCCSLATQPWRAWTFQLAGLSFRKRRCAQRWPGCQAMLLMASRLKNRQALHHGDIAACMAADRQADWVQTVASVDANPASKPVMRYAVVARLLAETIGATDLEDYAPVSVRDTIKGKAVIEGTKPFDTEGEPPEWRQFKLRPVEARARMAIAAQAPAHRSHHCTVHLTGVSGLAPAVQVRA